ncbi:MAG TPA: carbohydrate-binding protein [Thermoanaerobaculia bacterium]|nr:carbohydrate-binding protein [Thermoanaerobaculia bacterium]
MSISAAFCLMILCARSGSAQALATPEPEWVSRMLEEGWQKLQEGVLQRNPGEGRVETFTYGEEGLRFLAQSLEARVSSLDREYAVHPSPELGRILTTLKGELAQADTSLGAAQPEPFGGSSLAAGCGPSLTAHAFADPLSGSQAPGVAANADASFQSSCGDLGNVYSYAYARATAGTTMTVRSQEDPRSNGTSLASAAAAGVGGPLDCYSEAYARAWSPALGLSYEASDTNFACPGPSPTEQLPFRGVPFAVPGTIKAADFDNGGEGVAYHETTPGTGSSYRTAGVDMYEDFVLYLDTSEWLEYTIDVATAGTYALVAQVSANNPGGSFHVELDGVNVTGPLAVPATGAWSIWGSVVKAVSFPAGRHVLRVAADSWFDGFYSLRIVTAKLPFRGTPRTLPGTFRVADFDEGGEQISYHDNTAGCQMECSYRTADVDRWEHMVFDIGTGEWMEYTVNVTATGTYTLAVRVAAGSGGATTFHVEFDGVDVTGPLTIPITGGWSVFQTVTRTGVNLSAGRKVMRIVVDRGANNFDEGTFDTISIQP